MRTFEITIYRYTEISIYRDIDIGMGVMGKMGGDGNG